MTATDSRSKFSFSRADFFKLTNCEQNKHRTHYVQNVMKPGQLVVKKRGTINKVYQVVQNFAPETRVKYRIPMTLKGTKTILNSHWETQVRCVLNLSLGRKSGGLTSYDPIELVPIDVLKLALLRKQLDDLLNEYISGAQNG